MDSLQERIKDSLYISRKKPWYRRPAGIFIIATICLILVLVVVFTLRVTAYYKALSGGDTTGKMTTEEFINSLKLDAKVDLLQNSEDPTKGPVTAPVTIVAFEDFECPFCFQAQPFIKKLIAKYGDTVRFIYKDFPLRVIHPHAQETAEAAQCAFEQGKFWEFHDELFAHQDRFAEAYYRTVAKDVGMNLSQFNECYRTGKYRQRIADDVELGKALGVQGTPTFFINGELFVAGYSPEADEYFDQAIDYIKQL